MRKFILFLLLLPVSFLSAQWQQVGAPGVTDYATLAQGNGYLFAQRQNGQVRRSLSNGVAWEATAFPAAMNTYLFSMDADFNILASVTSGSSAQAFQSDDYGDTWQPLPAVPVQGFTDIFVSGGHIYLYVENNGLYRYRSAQYDWVTVLPLTTYNITFAFSGSQIWAGQNGNPGNLQYSANAGATWQTITTLPHFSTYHSIAADNNRLVVNSANGVFASIDNGLNWTAGNLSDPNAKILADDGGIYARSNDQLYSSPDGLNYSPILSGLGEIYDFEAINGIWIASTQYGLYHSAQNPAVWTWVESGLTSIYQYSILNSAGGVLFYSDNQTAYSQDAGLTWQVTNGLHRFRDVRFHNGNWYGMSYGFSPGLFQSSNLKDWVFRSIMPSDSTSTFWGYLGNTMVNSSGTTIYTSIDDGLTWQPQGLTPGSLFSFNGTLYSHGYGSDELFQSSNFGNNWTSLGPVLAADPEADFFLTSPGKIHALSNQNLLTSTDGISWVARSLQTINPSIFSFKAEVTSDGHVIVLIYDPAENHQLYLTQDDGLTWTSVMTGLNATLLWSTPVSMGNMVFVQDAYDIPWRRDASLVNPVQYAGRVYRDLNNNGLPDGGEPPLPNVALGLANTTQFTSSASDGAFSLFTEAHNDVLTASSPGKYCSFNPPSYAVNLTNIQLDFGLNCPAGITDLDISLVNDAPFRPGFFTTLYLTARNLGNDAASGTVTLTLDPALEFVSAAPFALPVGNVLTWSLNSLPSLDHAAFVVQVKTPATTPLGAVICVDAQTIPTVADQNPVDNSFELCRPAVGSYDPNDKQVSAGLLSPAEVGAEKPLVYTVRFQNTGTYLASLVVIKDTLSPNLNPGTLQVLGASHPLTWSLRENGILEFRFDGINLPDSNSNEPLSHGFVQFSVSPRNNLPLGEITPNTAHIYFDFNAPIVTNTVVSTVVGTHEPDGAVRLIVWPNPARETLSLRFPQGQAPGPILLHLHDGAGRLIRAIRLNGSETMLDVRDLEAGRYQLRGQEGQRYFSARFEVVR